MSCQKSIQSKATWRFFLFAVACFLLPSVARSQAQVPSSRVTLTSSTVSVEKFFSEVESQTNCLVVYSEANIQPSASVTFSRREAPLSSFIQEFASKFGLEYTYSNGYITFKKERSASSSGRLRGTVLEASGAPVMGAGVVIAQNPNVGTVTDLDGNFSINVSRGQTLRISSVGYESKEVPVNSFSPMTIVLDVSSEFLDDVIVIGYGSAKKADLTGATSSVEGDRIAAKSTPQLSTQLQGMMAGVQVTRSTGDPSGGATIRVRGITTNSTNDPLVIIDGVPGSLDDISSSDVKDIQVLKDAASASIYGSRAAAGVILVTTKRAKSNEFRMNYNFEYGLDKPTAVPEFARAALWMSGMNEVSF
ncbi:MAG: TonB-dependent receptor plug domain-containing protein, partial [Bacteroidales bacterium]|nr:TonB-dependent receptor plug domain-containing protein [Bacteroidales bacterium]